MLQGLVLIEIRNKPTPFRCGKDSDQPVESWHCRCRLVKVSQGKYRRAYGTLSLWSLCKSCGAITKGYGQRSRNPTPLGLGGCQRVLF